MQSQNLADITKPVEDEQTRTVFLVYTYAIAGSIPEEKAAMSGAKGDPEIQIIGVYESESEAREVAKSRDQHLAETKTDVKWHRHSVRATSLYKA